jgi:hypothetical protein
VRTVGRANSLEKIKKAVLIMKPMKCLTVVLDPLLRGKEIQNERKAHDLLFKLIELNRREDSTLEEQTAILKQIYELGYNSILQQSGVATFDQNGVVLEV